MRVDDAADNPDGESYDSSRVSEPFRVDNTSPRLEDVTVRRRGDSYEVSFSAHDPAGRVAAVEYALDGRTWRGVDPEDGVADSELERYSIRIAGDDLPPHVMLRVTDAFGNLGGDMRRLESP